MWNDANARHANFMSCLRRFRGVVTVTARGKWVSATNEATGQPTKEKEYRVQGQGDLGYDVNAWVRLSREAPPTIIGLRHWKYGIRPGRDEAKTIPDFNIGWLIFDLMGCKPGTTTARKQVELDADETLPHEVVTAPEPAAPAGNGRGQGNARPAAAQSSQQETPAAAQGTPAQQRPAAQDSAPRKLHPQQERQLRAEKAATAVDTILTTTDPKVATANESHARRSVAAGVPVFGLLTQAERDALGLDREQHGGMKVAELAAKVSLYVAEHNRSVRDPLDSNPVDPAAAMEAAVAAEQVPA
jgi:hypothetical protein